MRESMATINNLLFAKETPASRHVALLLLLCAALYVPYLGNTPFFDKGEPREAIMVQDIIQRGDWLLPLERFTAVVGFEHDQRHGFAAFIRGESFTTRQALTPATNEIRGFNGP